MATSARVEPDYHYVQWSAELNLGYYKSIPFEAEPIKHLLIPFENSRLRREISRDASQSFTHDEVKAYNSRVLYGVNKADTLNAIEYYDLLRSSPHILCIYTDASRFLNYLGAAAVFPSLNYHTASCNLGWSTQGHCTLARIMQSTFADVTTTGHDIWSAELVGILLGLEAACQLASSGQKIAMFTDQTRLYRKPTGLPWGELYGKVASALSKLHAKDVVVMTYYLPGRSDVEGVRRAHKAAMEAAFPKSMSILPELRSKFFACMELRSPITILCQKTKRRLRSLVVANSVSNTKAQPESLTAIGNAPDMDPINVVRRVPESTAKTRLNFYLPPSRGQANSVPREELGTERNAYEANLATNLDQCLPEMSSRTQKSSSAEQGIQSPRLRRTREPLNIKTVALPPRRSDPARRVGSKKQYARFPRLGITRC